MGEKEFDDKTVALAFWEMLKERMEGCRQLAADFYDTYEKRRSYLFTYSCDGGTVSTYAALSDEDYAAILKAYQQDEQENGPRGHADPASLEAVALERLEGIDWTEYVPETDQHWAGGPAEPVSVDLDDYRIFYDFTCVYYHDIDDVPDKVLYGRELSKEQFVTLLAHRLFDKNFTLEDVALIDDDLYHYLTADTARPHKYRMMFMPEISKCAESIMGSDAYQALPDIFGTPFQQILHGDICSIAEASGAADDQLLLKSFQIATVDDVIL